MELKPFCETFVRIGSTRMSFQGRGYLDEIYGAADGNLVLRCARQVEKSTLLSNLVTFNAVRYPGTRILYVCPRIDQAEVFSRSRLWPAITSSPLIRRALIGDKKMSPTSADLYFNNGSELFIRSAFHSADAARGISADMLLLDEYQDLAPGSLPVLMEIMSHSDRKQVVITGTPKHVDNPLESALSRSTNCEWLVACACGKEVRLDEEVITPEGYVCQTCRKLIDSQQGRWVARNPESDWAQGYCINQLMVPWVRVDDILVKQSDYDPLAFKNECLGLPTVLGDHVLTREEIESCCNKRPMARTLADVPRAGHSFLVAGLDWGADGPAATLLTIGYLSDHNRFHVVHFSRFRGTEDPQGTLNAVVRLCREFRVRFIGVDGSGTGVLHNWSLAEKLQGQAKVVGITYYGSNQKIRYQGPLTKWGIDRTENLGFTFHWIRQRQMEFPRLQDVRPFVEEFLNVVAEYNDYSHSIRYTKPETQRDDVVHSTTYALIVARNGACPPSSRLDL